MTKNRVGFILVIALASTLILSSPASALTLYNFKGTVKDLGGVVLPGASVSDGTQTTTTDANGSYVLPEASTGRFTLTASRSDTYISSIIVNVSVPVDQTENFQLAYQLTAGLSRQAFTTASGAATDTLTVMSWAPSPGTRSCVTVTDSRANTTSNATLSSSSNPSTWTWTETAPQNTAESTYSLTAQAIDCTTSTVLSSQPQASYVVDNTPPSILEMTPYDWGETAFLAQPIEARVSDTGGSGLDVSSIHFTLTDTTTNQSQTLSGSTIAFNSATGWAKTPAQSLIVGHVYTLSATAEDFAGNTTTVSDAPTSADGGFTAITQLNSVTNASIPSVSCTMQSGSSQSTQTAVCQNVNLHFDPASVALSGAHRRGGGFVEHTASLQSATISTTVNGTTTSLPAYNAGDPAWSPKTKSLRFEVSAPSTATLNLQTASLDSNIGTLQVMVPASWTNAILQMAPAQTSVMTSTCADPSASATTISCSPDPLATEYLVGFGNSVTNVPGTASSQVTSAGGKLLDTFGQGYRASLPFVSVATIQSDPSVAAMGKFLLRSGPASSGTAAAAVSSMLTEPLPDGLSDLKSGTPGAQTYAPGIGAAAGAYRTPIASSSSVVGYAISSATYEGAPVERLTHGDLSVMDSVQKSRAQSATGLTVVSESPIHLDNFSEGARFVMSDGSVGDVDLNQMTPLDGLGEFTAAPDQPSAETGDGALLSEFDWVGLIGDRSLLPLFFPSTSLPSTPTAQAKYVPGGGPGFPNYSWSTGCTPTAASMVEAYWSALGPLGDPSFMTSTDYAAATADDTIQDPNDYPPPGHNYSGDGYNDNNWGPAVAGVTAGPIPDGSSPQSRALTSSSSSVKGLGYYMQTNGSGGTYLNKILSGIQLWEKSKGVQRQYKEVQNPSLSRMISQIDSEQVPATVSLLGWLMNPITYSIGYGPWQGRIDHSAALIGYYNDQWGPVGPVTVSHLLDCPNLWNGSCSRGNWYMILHDAFRYDGETIVAYDSKSWSYSQFDYPKP